jgi:hypothetical protein
MAATASFASESDYQAAEKRWRGKAKTAEKAHDCMDAGGRAKQEARAEFTQRK